MHWAIWDAMFKAQNAIEGVISNFPNRAIAIVLRRMIFPLGRPYVVPSDRLGHEVARLLIEPSATRDRLTAGRERRGEARRGTDVAKTGKIGLALDGDDRLAAARAAGIISDDDAMVIRRAQRLTELVIRVDDFPQDLGVAGMRPQDASPVRAATTTVRKAAA